MKKNRFSYSLPVLTKRLFSLARPIRGYLTVSTLASIIGNLSHMGLMGFGAMWFLCTAGWADGSAVLYACLAVISAALIAVCRYLEGVFSHIGAYGLLAKLRIRMFENLDRVAPAYMVDRKKGDLLNIAVSDIETLEFFFAHMIGPMFTVFLLPITALAVAGHYHSLYALILLPVYILISVLIPLAALKAGRNIGKRHRENLAALKSVILESVYGMQDIQIFGYGGEKTAEMLDANAAVNRSAHSLTMHRQIVSAAPGFFVYIARILVLLAATYLTGLKLNDPAGTVVVSFIATASFSSTFSLTSVVSNLLETYAAAERFFLIEDAEPAVKEKDLPRETGEISAIRFDSVSFAYPGTDKEILSGLDLSVSKGEHIGIQGESGAGKSTLFRLLLHFYEPDSGSIEINGIPLTDVSMGELHSRIAMLEQETYLFDASISDNIAVAKPSATPEEIKRAAERAGIAEFIETLPDGYRTEMGQMSARLSGGERQRVGIARIMLADPDVIVMDEPTSALDVLHEKEFLETLESAYRDKTVIMISHRASTLKFCSRVYRLESGRLAETGHGALGD